MRKSGWTLIGCIFIGGLLGGIFSAILTVVVPDGPVQAFFLQSVSPAIDPPLTLDLVLIKITLGLLLNVNLFTVFGVLLGLYLYKHL